MGRPKIQVRLERLAAEREALAHTRSTSEVYVYLPRETLERVEEERRLYAFAPARSEVLRQLITEGLAFRRANRPVPKPQKRVPFPGL
jgi:hypothetical protein